MRARCWFSVVLGTVALGAPAAGRSDESAKIAAGLLGVADLRSAVAEVVAASVPPGTATQLALALVGRDEQLWAALGDELAARLASALEPEALRILAESVEQDAAAAWTEQFETLAPVLRTALEAESGALTRFGCSIGLIAGPADLAIERARAAGKSPDLANLVERLAPLLPRLRETCDCALSALPGGTLTAGLEDPARRQEIAAILRSTIESGACPDPFAQPSGR